jgi:hypothetical protein
MKKVILTISAFAFVAVLFSSCKSHEKCPAYSKVNTHNQHTKIA